MKTIILKARIIADVNKFTESLESLNSSLQSIVEEHSKEVDKAICEVLSRFFGEVVTPNDKDRVLEMFIELSEQGLEVHQEYKNTILDRIPGKSIERYRGCSNMSIYIRKIQKPNE